MVRSRQVLTHLSSWMSFGHRYAKLTSLQGMLLDEQTGCLLKFSGELEDVSREDFHDLFAGHGKIKWVDFTRGAKEVTTRKKQQPLYHTSVQFCVKRCDEV